VKDILPKIKAMKTLGVPYSDETIRDVELLYKAESEKIVAELLKDGVSVESDKEIIALIAYLQKLGTDLPKAKQAGE
jgi:cytochrome c oxidase cbb3-type subunit I/II